MINRESNRRNFLKAAGLTTVTLASGLSVPAAHAQEGELPEVEIISSYPLGLWYFEPAGLYIPVGQRVRFTARKWGATVTAFHPSNQNHELRIPEGAKPFNSGLLTNDYVPGKVFEWTFTVEGTYDYYSMNHEVLGMVGRIIVGRPGGPGENKPGYGGEDGRAPMFPKSITLFSRLGSAAIMQEKSIAFPKSVFQTKYPR
jgi:plastocyanin